MAKYPGRTAGNDNPGSTDDHARDDERHDIIHRQEVRNREHDQKQEQGRARRCGYRQQLPEPLSQYQ
jgi:hypothetical protein